MGLHDRDYYWEDRRRREEKYNKKRIGSGAKEGRSKVRRLGFKKIDMYSYLSGFLSSLLVVSFMLNLVPGFSLFITRPARGILEFFGVL